MDSEWIMSAAPAACLAEGANVVLGIDESGRGPLLGPMTYACAYWAEGDEAHAVARGFADSKALNEAKRDALFDALRGDAALGYAVEVIPPAALSAAMLRRSPVSLNAVSHASAANLLRAVLALGVRVTRVFVDTVGDPGAYQAKLSRAFGPGIAFTVCPKADALYPCVSAASIAAKVTRDRVLRDWVFAEPLLRAACGPPLGAKPPPRAAAKSAAAAAATAAAAAASGEEDAAGDDEREDGDGGSGSGSDGDGDSGGGAAAAAPPAKRARSAAAPPPGARSGGGIGAGGAMIHPSHAKSGYPGDPATKAWVADTFERVFGWPDVVRFSWSTAKDYLDANGVAVDWGEDAPAAAEGGAAASAAASAPAQTGLGSYFAAAPRGGGLRCAIAPITRPQFFRKRGLRPVTDIIG